MHDVSGLEQRPTANRNMITRNPTFTVFDGMLSYERGNWRASLNGKNLADKEYIASCTYGCFYGASREISLSLGYRW